MPDIIHLLPDAVANQIAAGEVVQRPSSAVKELMENAIDAGADQIKLIIKDAGKSLIQVIDNGSGMSAADARLSLQRHATSKISRAEDLFEIRTMGFRGEAMASIAAISHLEIKTSRHEDELGTVIQVAGSELISLEPDALPTGTSISVKNLFYNIPARRNFLKSDGVELRHIMDEFQRIALAHPTIHFSMYQDGNEVYHLTPGSLKQRVVHLFGKNYNERLVPIEEETTIIKLKGFIGKPQFAKKSRGEQFFFVNKRFVKDAYLHHAILKAYQEVLPDDTYPLYVLFIDIDPARIDINVHPTKTEIKYEDDKSIYAIVRSAVKRSLGQYHITPSLDFDQENNFSQFMQPKAFNEIIPPSVSFNPDFNPFKGDHAYDVTRQVETRQLTMQQYIGEEIEDKDMNEKKELQVKSRLFQIHKTFILSQIHSGFILIDQQSAHERILFEQFMEQLESRQGMIQQSLFPQTIELNPGDTALVREILPDIQSLGFQLREFGRNTFVVEGVPADLGLGIREKEVIEGLLEDLNNKQDKSELDRRKQLATSLARRAAIKKGTELSQQEMSELIDRLFACESANISLQGKPVILTFTTQELWERFGR